MTSIRDSTFEMTAAANALGALNAQSRAVLAELKRLRCDLDATQRALTEVSPSQILETNEQLVLAALAAEAIAETALDSLDAASQCSHRDPVTGTPNRVLLLDRLGNGIELARRRGKRLCVLFIDIDGFKAFNDTRGHALGDDILRLVARGLASAVRGSDTVGRYGGDEFLALLTDVENRTDAGLVAKKMQDALNGPGRSGDALQGLSLSIGIAAYPEDGDEPDQLIRHADEAMYSAKRSGPGQVRFYSADAVPSTPRRVTMNPSLPGALSTLVNVREANDQLIAAVLQSEELERTSREEHRRHILFLAVVAHELRNPLNPIRFATELLGRTREEPELLVEIQETIQRQVKHMARLVDDLLDGSRVATGGLKVERTVIDLNGVLRTVVIASQRNFEIRAQELHLQLPNVLALVDGDAMRLTQVFLNLLDNASKHTPKGGECSVELRVLGETVEVVVADNGVGIAGDLLPHVFDLFVQSRQAAIHDRSGLGIGLAVVRDLVHAHGGTVVARSAGKSHGSTFVVTLPRWGATNAT